MTQINLEKIKEISQLFFTKMNLGIEVEVKSQDSTVDINLKLDEPQILIGERGQTLAEVQHLLRAVLRKQLGRSQEHFYINLDINDYKKKKAEYLKEIARTAADEVALTKKEKKLPPMPAFERRIIHLELAPREDVVTESIGQEPERYVVIRSYP